MLSTLVVMASLLTAQGAWELAGETDGIKVFTRAKAGSDVREVKAMGEIDATPEACFRVVGDFEHYPDFMPYTRTSKVVAREGKSTFVYWYITPPIVSNRDYTLKLTDHSIPDGESPFYKVAWEPANDRGPAPRSDAVRLEVNRGFWLFEPTEDTKRTSVTYYLYTDPAGSIPTFLVNKANRESVPDVIKSVRKRVIQTARRASIQ